MSRRIYYIKSSITELEVRYATDAATNEWGERCYEYNHDWNGKFIVVVPNIEII